jgi:ketosteroid isomerase-like protein
MSQITHEEATALELYELEMQYWQALKDQDADAAMRLTDEPCLVVSAQGADAVDRTSPATMIAMMKDAHCSLDDFALKDGKVRLIGDDIAIFAYNVHEELTVDGERITLEAADASTWVRRGGRWLCVLHTEALSGDPFGRDKLARNERDNLH